MCIFSGLNMLPSNVGLEVTFKCLDHNFYEKGGKNLYSWWDSGSPAVSCVPWVLHYTHTSLLVTGRTDGCWSISNYMHLCAPSENELSYNIRCTKRQQGNKKIPQHPQKREGWMIRGTNTLVLAAGTSVQPSERTGHCPGLRITKPVLRTINTYKEPNLTHARLNVNVNVYQVKNSIEKAQKYTSNLSMFKTRHWGQADSSPLVLMELHQQPYSFFFLINTYNSFCYLKKK